MDDRTRRAACRTLQHELGACVQQYDAVFLRTVFARRPDPGPRPYVGSCALEPNMSSTSRRSCGTPVGLAGVERDCSGAETGDEVLGTLAS
jgi:hypothetical protein